MYTVGVDSLRTDESVANALRNMQRMSIGHLPHFNGVVFEETDDPSKLQTILYAGIVLTACVEPPSFTLLCESAELQVDQCDCEYPISFNDLLEDFESAAAIANLAAGCDGLASGDKPDPHYQVLHERVGKEISVPFRFLGWHALFSISPITQ